MTLTVGDRAAGSLLGLALGDALGFVVEAAPAAQAAQYVRTDLRAGIPRLRARPSFSAGQYSDDTQLARELLLSIRDARGFDPAGFARRVGALFAEGRAVGAGPGTRGAAERLGAGVAWADAGAPPPYAGNGAAMRAGPLGPLCAAGGPEVLIRIAGDQALVTHRDPRAVAGAVAIAGAAALAARPGTLVPRHLLEELGEWVRPIDATMADMTAAVAAWVGLAPTEAIRRLARISGSDGPWAGVSSSVVPSVAWSLFAFVRSPDDHWETLCTAIEVGGDTDTMAAMAGALSGARLGPGALPGALLSHLNDAGAWRSEDLSRLAYDCAAGFLL